MRAETRALLVPGLLLAVTALTGTAILSVADWHSAPYIAQNKRQALLRGLEEVMPAGQFDNDIVQDTTSIADPDLLKIEGETLVYRARKRGVAVAAAFRLAAPDGYAGDIELLMGVDAKGSITGVRVINHHETPGLGDAIEPQNSNWIFGFFGKSLTDPGASGWHVRRDGGQFDQFTGATITPRAVVAAVRRGLEFFNKHRERIFVEDPQADGKSVDQEK